MGRKRKMPSREKIFKHWKNKLNNITNNNTCFKCGVTPFFNKKNIIVDRAHILAVCEGGTDDLNNLHLLCKSCHRESEAYSGVEYDLWFTSRNKEEFATSLFLLWEKGEIEDTPLNKYFKKIKSNFINKYSKQIYECQMLDYSIQNKLHLDNYYKTNKI